MVKEELLKLEAPCSLSDLASLHQSRCIERILEVRTWATSGQFLAQG
jgi:hypothetical protein